MHSTMQEPPGWDGGTDAEQRLEAALVQVRTVVGDALAAPMLSLRPERLGRLLELHGVDEAMMAALKLAMVARADACDAAKTTGAVSTRVWLRTTQRMSVKDASATVNLARDLDRTVTLTARALGRGDISFRHAQVIAFAIKDLPTWVSPDQLVEAEKFLIAESKRRNPDDVRVLGRHLLQAIAPEEWERRLGEQLAKEEAAAERKRSLCFMANGIPGSETVVIKLPVVEMEQLRKIIEALVAADTRPDDRPLDQKRGDVFADLVTQWAQQQASPNRGRGRDCVTVLIHLHQLMNGIGFGTIDDLNPVRPMPCGCQTPDAKRQNAKRKAREHTKRNKSSASEGPRSSTTPCDTTDAGPGERAGDGESVKPDKAETTKPGRNPGSNGAVTSEDAEPSRNGEPSNANRSENADDTGTDAQPGRAVTDPDDPDDPGDPAGTGEGAVPTGTSAPEAAPTAAETTATALEREPDNEKPPADQPDPPAGVAERIPAPREPGQPPQPNTATGIQPESGIEPDPETEPGPGSDPGPDTGPENCDLVAEEDDADDDEPEEGAAGPEAAFDPTTGAASAVVADRLASPDCAESRSRWPRFGGWRATRTSSRSSSAATARSSMSGWPTGSSPKPNAAPSRSVTGPTATSLNARSPNDSASPTT
ncbi:protein of unknown function [Actinopolymorpha cephalotaxi]|uniref:DUF222 domain-containing protein n=1 Tax=Actinopolymorpha cephalotaxi TaxID=504797 RepID=A0A1I3AWI0_9ACTN|nr:DUF222 domain-containing protein [Actinopolymorpha cephalotaxi]NYH84321.1 hypothetical protein [Actinopolymorpha cephalotaxi]SFH54427.1 protein of unknown function [Actinopolymorpha cephalotaxi]